MAKRSGLGPLGRQVLENAAAGKAEAHPLISALQFNAYTREHGGASMDVNTGEILEPGKTDVVIVGGERDTAGKRIPTTYYGRSRKGGAPKDVDLSPIDVARERRRVKTLTGNRPGAYVGSYVSPEEPEKGVQMDASAGITDRSKVIPTLRERNEESAWDNKNQDLIMNPYYKRQGRKK